MAHEITQWLLKWGAGDEAALNELLPLVYDELRQLARSHMRRQAPPHTLQPTALVHEAYLRLVGPGQDEALWDNRGHFFAAAAEAMRRILVEQARSKGRQKRGGDRKRFNIDAIDVAVQATPDQLLAVDEALEKLRSSLKQPPHCTKR